MPQATPRFYLARLRNKIWEWPGDEASQDLLENKLFLSRVDLANWCVLNMHMRQLFDLQ